MYLNMISKIVRWYLRNVPITEGKNKLLHLTHAVIIPKKSYQTEKMKQGFFLKLNLENKEHLHMWLYGEHDERYEIKIIRKILNEGDVVWDIGANIGYYTCYFSYLLGKTGTVFSFEPAKKTYEYLSSQIELNQFTNAHLLPLGLGNTLGKAQLHYNNPDAAEGTASLKYIEGKSVSETIDVETLDHLLSEKNICQANFIKIDVEGFQKEVFEGGELFFRKESPLIMVELKEKDKNEMAGLEKLLRSWGYDIYEVHKKGLKPCQDTTRSEKRNFILSKRNTENFNRIEKVLL